MNDEELLELAAKAAGIEDELDFESDTVYWRVGGLDWNPLADDGDALRLAVKLGFRITHDEYETYRRQKQVRVQFSLIRNLWEDYTDDPCAATRRAIVRAAAEIGKGR